MNSSKRGAVYGFKLQSLDLVTHTHTPYVSVSVQLVASCHQSTDAKETWLLICENRFFLCSAAGDKVNRPLADIIALHRQYGPRQISRSLSILQRTSLCRQSSCRWVLLNKQCRPVSDHRSEPWGKKHRFSGYVKPGCCHMILGPDLVFKKIIKNSIKLIWESSLDRRWTEKCSHLYAVSLENVLCDVKELQRGMELTWREFSVQHNSTLKDFISRNESRLNKLQEDACIAKVSSCVLHLSTDQLCDCSTFQRKTVNKNYSDSLQDAFEDVVTFFGESSKTMPPSVFFPVFVRFIKAYRVSKHVKFHLLIRLSVCKAPPIQGPSESEQLAVRRRIICTECFVEIRWQKRRTNRGGVRSRCYLRKWSRRSSRKKTPRWDSHLWVFPGQYCSFSLKKLRDTCESRWTPSFLITGLIRMMKPPDSRWWFLKLFNENKNHWLESS